MAQVMDWVLNEEKFDLNAGILHHAEGVDLMPANIELSGVEISLVGIMSSETVLKEYIEMIDDRYDYIIMQMRLRMSYTRYMEIVFIKVYLFDNSRDKKKFIPDYSCLL